MLSLLLRALLLFLPLITAFDESLLLRPLPQNALLKHYHFHTKANSKLQNKAFLQLLKQHQIENLFISLSSGKWREEWGFIDWQNNDVFKKETANLHLKSAPLGAQVFALFSHNTSTPHSKTQHIDHEWSSTLHTLSGLLCSSVHHLNTKIHTLNPKALRILNSTQLHYARAGALTRESVCTENLTPFLKSLPCRSEQGIAKVLADESAKMFKSMYQSIRYEFQRSGRGWEIRQSVVSVQLIDKFYNFEIEKMCDCVLSSSANVFVEIPPFISRQHSNSIQKLLRNENLSESDSFVLPVSKPSQVRQIDNYVILTYNLKSPHPGTGCIEPKFGLKNFVGEFPLPLLSVQRYLTHSDHHSGSLYLEVTNNRDRNVELVIYDSIPWFLRTYFHTSALRINSSDYSNALFVTSATSPVKTFSFEPSILRGRPAEYLLEISLPSYSTMQYSVWFEKSFLTINNEYPPDVSRGFDLPTAIIEIKEQNNRIYSDSAIVLLPFPDASMPFNVLAFTCTVIAFFFGNFLNLLYSTDEQILLRAKQGPGGKFRGRIKTLTTFVKKRFNQKKSSHLHQD